jgi:hypothetical protein
MGAAIAIDLRKSFAMSTKGPSIMLGKRSQRGSVITDEYHDAETERVADQKTAAKRAQKPDRSRPKAKRDKPKGGRPDKKRRPPDSNWGSYWVNPNPRMSSFPSHSLES